MNQIAPAQSLDIDSLINNLQVDANKSEIETNKASSAKIRTQAEKIKEKRQEQLDNIKERMKGASGGGCLKFLKTIFKVFDLLLKPLSAITAGQLKLELGKVFERLEKAKANGKLLGLQINGEEIQGALQDLKKIFEQDTQRYQNQEELSHQQNQRIITIIEEVHDSFNKSVNS